MMLTFDQSLTLAQARSRVRFYLNEVAGAGQWTNDRIDDCIRDASAEVYHYLSTAAPDRCTQFVFWPWLAGRAHMRLNSLWLKSFGQQQQIVRYDYTTNHLSPLILHTSWSQTVSVDPIGKTDAQVVAAVVAQLNGYPGTPVVAWADTGATWFKVSANQAGVAFDLKEQPPAPPHQNSLTVTVLSKNLPFAAPDDVATMKPTGIFIHHVLAVWLIPTTPTTPTFATGPTVDANTGLVTGPTFADVREAEWFKNAALLDVIENLVDMFADSDARSSENAYLRESDAKDTRYRYRIEDQQTMWMRPTPGTDQTLLLAYVPHVALPTQEDDPCLASWVLFPWKVLAEKDEMTPQATVGKMPVFPDFHQLVALLAAINCMLMTRQDPSPLNSLYERRRQSAIDSLATTMQQQQAPVPRAAVRR